MNTVILTIDLGILIGNFNIAFYYHLNEDKQLVFEYELKKENREHDRNSFYIAKKDKDEVRWTRQDSLEHSNNDKY